MPKNVTKRMTAAADNYETGIGSVPTGDPHVDPGNPDGPNGFLTFLKGVGENLRSGQDLFPLPAPVSVPVPVVVP